MYKSSLFSKINEKKIQTTDDESLAAFKRYLEMEVRQIPKCVLSEIVKADICHFPPLLITTRCFLSFLGAYYHCRPLHVTTHNLLSLSTAFYTHCVLLPIITRPILSLSTTSYHYPLRVLNIAVAV